jgi:CRISPR-associated endonuclease/helicase Cas3
MSNDLDRKHREMETAASRRETSSSLAGDSSRCSPEHGLREGAGGDEPSSRDTRPDRATRFIETTRGILSYSDIAPLLAEQVLLVESRIYRGDFSSHLLDESLAAEIHRLISFDLVPDWAGKWRTIDVRVGNLEPPKPPIVPMLMRDYGADLAARWHEASSRIGDLTLEFLAFAEGRFLTIHPFADFNGRTIRLFLLELLRRLDLPELELAPQSDQQREKYFLALEAADQSDWAPLIEIWQSRLTPEN